MVGGQDRADIRVIGGQDRADIRVMGGQDRADIRVVWSVTDLTLGWFGG